MRAETTTTSGVEETRVLDVVFPDNANHYGTLFGGSALNLMGKTAFLAATRHARRHVVMASSDKITFKEPIPVGDLIECVARISRTGRTSMTVPVDLFREDRLSGARSLAAHGSFEMVAVDTDGRPTHISRSNQPTEIQEESVS